MFMKKVNAKRAINRHERYVRNAFSDVVSIVLLAMLIYYAFA